MAVKLGGKKISASDVGRVGGIVTGGAIAGPIIGTGIGGKIGESMGRSVDTAVNGAPKSNVGDIIPMPVLPEYQGISTLGDRGRLNAITLSGTEIKSQMEQSPWYQMALQKQAAEQGQNFNQAAQQAAMGAAQARQNLAMRGGLRSGASERLASQAGEQAAIGRQNVLGQGAVERGQLGMQGADLASRLGQFNVGQQTAANQANFQAALADLAARNQSEQFKYGEQMKLKGAGMTAQGIQNAGKK